jgi:hypothetical protein
MALFASRSSGSTIEKSDTLSSTIHGSHSRCVRRYRTLRLALRDQGSFPWSGDAADGCCLRRRISRSSASTVGMGVPLRM